MPNQEVDALRAPFARANHVNGLHHDEQATLTNMSLDNAVITDEARQLVSRWITQIQHIPTIVGDTGGSSYRLSPVAIAADSANRIPPTVSSRH